MNLRDKIQKDITIALKKQEKQKLEVLRFLNAQIQNKEIEKGRKKLQDEEVVRLINNQIEKLNESLSFFRQAKREDLIEKARKELEILKSYLPRQLSDEKLEKEIERIIQENPSISQPGALIGICVKTLAGKADNKRIAQMVMRKIKRV